MASLAAAKPVWASGLLGEAAGGVIEVPMAERMAPAIAGPLAQFLDNRSEREGAVLLMFDDSAADDGRPPAALLDRVAFDIDLGGAMPDDRTEARGDPLRLDEVELLDGDQRRTLVELAKALGVDALRSLAFSEIAARANAALHGRTTAEEIDLLTAGRLVLGPRATRIPQAPPEDATSPPSSDEQESSRQSDTLDAQDLSVAAAAALIPANLLKQLADGHANRRGKAGGSGRRARSASRGRPLPSRPGSPRLGARLALIDTLRAAAPWQALRRQERPDSDARLQVRKSDLRVRRFEERSVAVTIFCVDASGSAAHARLAEAKGAVERLLAQAYVTRSEVALVAFRGTGADLILPPTRSLTRARRALSDLPGGGGTPLAAGIGLARAVGEQSVGRGRSPLLVLLTDGSANVALDGSGDRVRAGADALAAAKSVARSGIDTLLIDISLRPRPAAAELATAMGARCIPLPQGRADAIGQAVRSAQAR